MKINAIRYLVVKSKQERAIRLRRFMMPLMVLCALLMVGSNASAQESQPTAQPTDPESVYRAEYAAQNAGDASASRFAQDVVNVTVPPPPGSNGIFIGWEAIHKITEEVVAAHADVQFADFQVNGDTATFTALVTADFIRDVGIDTPLELSGMAIVRDGLIQFEAWVMREESQARFEAAIARHESKAVVERLYEQVMNQKDLSIAEELYAATVVDHDAGDEGSAAVQAGIAALLAGLPDLQVTTELWSIDGDLVTTRVTFSGTHQGEWLGVAPTGKSVTWSHIDIHRIQNGKITDIWHTVPVGAIQQQLGDEPVPPAQ